MLLVGLSQNTTFIIDRETIYENFRFKVKEVLVASARDSPQNPSFPNETAFRSGLRFLAASEIKTKSVRWFAEEQDDKVITGLSSQAAVCLISSCFITAVLHPV